MARKTLSPFILLSLVAACGSPQTAAPTAANQGPALPPPTTASPTPKAAVVETPKKPEPTPTPEEKKKAEEARQLQEDRAKFEEENAKERARWTPDMHAAAKALVEKAHPNARAALQAALAGKHRKPTNAERDKYRHPLETLEFFGVKPNMTVLDIGPGEGWYTEILAPVLSAKGKLLVTGGDPNGPADQRSAFYAQRFKAFTENAPELYGKVDSLVVDSKAPKLGANADGTIDVVLIMRGLHGMKNGGTLGAWLTEIHRTLKPNGVLGIEEHRAKPDANVDESAKKGYVPEKWAIEQIEAAGFKLAGKSDINANVNDTKDHPEGVWTLPPTLRLKDKDREKYLTIGESDRMTLKFVKVKK